MATLTINTTTENAIRLASAYGLFLGLTDGNGDPRPATNTEVKTAVIEHLKQITFDQEDRVNKAAVSTPRIDPT